MKRELKNRKLTQKNDNNNLTMKSVLSQQKAYNN